jgi:ABC-type transport system involved in Fe-S cluster assembly fused permease/ATPase subunit
MTNTYEKSTITLAGRINTYNSSFLIHVTCTQFYTANFTLIQTNSQRNRRYSINTSNNNANPMSIVPILSYSNAEIMKSEILEENRNKTGIYR